MPLRPLPVSLRESATGDPQLRVLTELSMSAQEPLARLNLTRCPVFALAANNLACLFDLLSHPLIGGNNFIKSIGDLSFDSSMVTAHPNGEISAAHFLERGKEILQ